MHVTPTFTKGPHSSLVSSGALTTFVDRPEAPRFDREEDDDEKSVCVTRSIFLRRRVPTASLAAWVRGRHIRRSESELSEHRSSAPCWD